MEGHTCLNLACLLSFSREIGSARFDCYLCKRHIYEEWYTGPVQCPLFCNISCELLAVRLRAPHHSRLPGSADVPACLPRLSKTQVQSRNNIRGQGEGEGVYKAIDKKNGTQTKERLHCMGRHPLSKKKKKWFGRQGKKVSKNTAVNRRRCICIASVDTISLPCEQRL